MFVSWHTRRPRHHQDRTRLIGIPTECLLTSAVFTARGHRSRPHCSHFLFPASGEARIMLALTERRYVQSSSMCGGRGLTGSSYHPGPRTTRLTSSWTRPGHQQFSLSPRSSSRSPPTQMAWIVILSLCALKCVDISCIFGISKGGMRNGRGYRHER